MTAGWRIRLAMSGIGCSLVGLALLAPAQAAVPSFEPAVYMLRLTGTHGYTITIAAAAEKADGRGAVTVSVSRPGAVANYTTDGTVTTSSIHADFGSLGQIDAVVKLSGRTRQVRIIPCGPYTETFEPGAVAGSIEFRGEAGFTTATASRAPLVPGIPFVGGCSNGYGESFGRQFQGASQRRLLRRRPDPHLSGQQEPPQGADALHGVAEGTARKHEDLPRNQRDRRSRCVSV